MVQKQYIEAGHTEFHIKPNFDVLNLQKYLVVPINNEKNGQEWETLGGKKDTPQTLQCNVQYNKSYDLKCAKG